MCPVRQEGVFMHRGLLKTHRVPQEAVHSLWSRLFCGPLKMRCVPQEPVLRTEYLFRTVEACFLHRMLHENASRTPGGLFEHGTHIPYHRRPSPVPNARHRGRLPPQRSLANILVDLLCATGLAAVSINPLQAPAAGVSCNGAQQGVHITYK